MPSLDEFERIRDWNEGRQSKEFLGREGVVVGIGDDAAVVSSGSTDQEWLFAVDTMVEEIHFRADTMSEADVGYKALAANVSDIAAMGGVPKMALVSICVPPAWTPERVKLLYDGLYECADRYGIAIIGGDTTSAPRQLVVSVTIIGRVEAGRAIRRDGAKPGQLVILTGPTGLSAGGLHGLLNKGDQDSPSANADDRIPQRLMQAHQRPVPSVKAGRILLESGGVTSLNDVSDGLASEAWEISEASQVRLLIRERWLPVSGELAAYAGDQGLRPLDWMLYGGEDYVLLGTVDRGQEQALKERFRKEGIPLFIIGEVEPGTPEVVLETASGSLKAVRKGGYNHFPKG